jgi:hypothetical protein
MMDLLKDLIRDPLAYAGLGMCWIGYLISESSKFDIFTVPLLAFGCVVIGIRLVFSIYESYLKNYFERNYKLILDQKDEHIKNLTEDAKSLRETVTNKMATENMAQDLIRKGIDGTHAPKRIVGDYEVDDGGIGTTG